MNFEQIIKDYKESMNVVPNEQSIKETVRKSIEVYCTAEQERMLSYWDFLWAQLRHIRKRWWFFQLLLLFMLWAALPSAQGEELLQRIFGVVAVLFVILVIPELWKSQTYQLREIEATSYYSLRQIYAARMFLFGIVDVVLITVFCANAAITMNILISQLMVQFLFPMEVTTAICFGILCSRYCVSEATAIMMCVAWSAVWLVIILNDRIYNAITFPLWIAFMGTAFVLLAAAMYRMLHDCNHFMEENPYGIGIG